MKYKDLLDKKYKRKFKIDLAYEEWLSQFIKNPTDELNQMEKESINNSSYNPIKGA